MIDRLRTKLLKSNVHMDVGRFTYGAPKVLTFPSGSRLRIGSFCSIADEVTILLGGNHDSGRVSTYPFNALFDKDGLPPHETSNGDVVIGHDVWIGYGATILSGTWIGDGAVVGAGSVVSGSVAPYAIVAGNPARLLRHRFDEKTVRRIQELSWWDWPTEKIRERAKGLMNLAKEFDQ